MSSGITNGNAFGTYILSASLTPSSVATITTAEQVFTVTGTNPGDVVFVNPPSLTAGVTCTACRVAVADTVRIQFVNPTAGSVTPPAGTYVFLIARPESGVAATKISD